MPSYTQRMIEAAVREREAPGEAEFQSWINVLRVERDGQCPSGLMHGPQESLDPATGYFWRCTRCGHHFAEPF